MLNQFCFRDSEKLTDNYIFAKKSTESKEEFIDFIEKIGLLKDISKKNANKIYIKPNFMTYIHPNGLNYTSIELLRYLCEYLEINGFKPIILESNMFYNTIFPKHNVNYIAKKLHIDFAQIINLSETEKANFFFNDKVYPISSLFSKQDYYFINFPKLKSHPIFSFTCCVKNIYGCYPDSNKLLKFHKELGITPSILAINHCIKPDFNIVDAIKCQDRVHDLLPIELKDYFYKYDYLLASKNALSIDLLIDQLLDPLISKTELFDLEDIYEKSFKTELSLPKLKGFKHKSHLSHELWEIFTRLPYENEHFFWGMKKIFKKNLENPKYLWDLDIFNFNT